MHVIEQMAVEGPVAFLVGGEVEGGAAAGLDDYRVLLRLAIGGLEALRPGCDPGLDAVCDGILTGAPFEYDAQRYGAGDGRLQAP